MALCLVGAAAVARIASATFVLAWTHSVQKTNWQESWRVEGGRFLLEEARVEGSGAGMEPQTGARFDGRYWRWRPRVEASEEIRLARFLADDWRLCVDGDCRTIGERLPGENGDVTLRVCD